MVPHKIGYVAGQASSRIQLNRELAVTEALLSA